MKMTVAFCTLLFKKRTHDEEAPDLWLSFFKAFAKPCSESSPGAWLGLIAMTALAFIPTACTNPLTSGYPNNNLLFSIAHVRMRRVSSLLRSYIK